ncbi:MAG: hypothetical protein ACHQK9_00815 [Reyranellales bacterium]
MKFSKEFFDLQTRFACRVAELSGMPLEQALLDYTNLYVRFGLGRDFDPEHPIWTDFVTGFARTTDRAEWTYRFFLSRENRPGPPSIVATSGCFSYGREQTEYIRIHFENVESDGQAPLGVEQVGSRRAELRSLFEHVKRTQQGVQRVAGVSWLYNLPAYRRLFPETYLATAKIAERRFRNMPLWGQFLDRHGTVRATAAKVFLERLSRQGDMEHLAQCFPLLPLAVEAPLPDFYKFHRID